ncbi:MAG: hypothetical protein CO073_02000 [Candidatus Komeilibacteria bacterium CG_4_9_14_0_8_um_filter_36_9]|uniref:Uncharacterized protein n=1 Tax=Candidatus Komeilibacteria bacterium CG_4_9_14_0_8_um_filter_36_9 TaxID=1974473 RepID=A0A2M8DRG2_9BACT|nr:MAG: hypothetical protein CO073_02000 [Candidatus Komeilibacteria bacterium CG_4_9_14_0_8_um_filter_36_9]
METNKFQILKNTLFWGLIVWLFGYILGFVFFALVPTNVIGWYIMPLAIIFTLWVLLKKIKREFPKCYIGLGIIWTVMAVVLDYVFIVLLLKAADYYKLDVFLYYILTLALPILVGLYKFKKDKAVVK